MATTSFLYHTLGLRGYRHLKTEFRDGAVFHHVARQERFRACANCGAERVDLVFTGRFERTFHALPVGAKKQFVVLHGHEQACSRCGCRLREPIPFAEGKRRFLRCFGRFVLDLCKCMTLLDVAKTLGVSWDLVKAILARALRQKLKKRRLSQVRYIAIDEFSVRKGHKYMTVVLDLDSGAILHAQQGKDADAVIGFLRRLKRSRARLKAVAIDMSQAYANAVRTVFGSKVPLVFDPYHVVSLANKAIDETRRDLYRELDGRGRKVIKGSRFLLLRAVENLSEDATDRLKRLLDLNEPLSKAYMLKEELRDFWNRDNRSSAKRHIRGWLEEARASGLPHFVKLADTIEQHLEGLLAFYSHRITTGPLEGLNNKIKVLKRRAYGYRDIEFFKLRLYFLHETRETITAFSG
jgi:transposase